MGKVKKRGKNGLFSLIVVLLVFAAVMGAFGFYQSGAYVGGNRSNIVSGELEIHYIDIGQGDSTLIKCGEHAMLIDAGENDCGTQIQNYLNSQNVTKLDYIIGTHPHSDHIGGMDVIIYKFDCDVVMMPDVSNNTKTYRDVISAMKSRNYVNTAPKPGDTYKLGDAEFTIIAPSRTYDDYNNDSIGLILKYGDRKFLFTGDAEEEAEADIVKTGIDIDCDVYQVGHHGSRTSSSETLLNAANPAYAVISCAEGNSYGHPHAQTLNEFRYRGIKVYRTDEQGTIVCTTDGIELKWNCSPSESWKSGEPSKSSKQ